MSLKDEFLKALDEALPVGILGCIDARIPPAPSVTVTDVNSAIFAMGVLSQYLCDLCREFLGLTPVELLLRIGQRNATLQAMLLLSLEFIGSQSFKILAPLPGQEYYEMLQSFRVQAIDTNITSITVQLNNEPAITLQQGEDRIFSAEVILTPDTRYTAVFRSNVGTQRAVIFEAVFEFILSTYPAEGDVVSVPEGEPIPFMAEVAAQAGVAITGATVTISGVNGENPSTYELLKNMAGSLYELTPEAASALATNLRNMTSGAYRAVYEFSGETAAIAKKTVTWIWNRVF